MESTPVQEPEEETRSDAMAKRSQQCSLERRWVLFLFAFGCTSLVSGVVYGWPALRRQLQDEGSTLTEAQMGAIFTVGSWGTQGGRFFIGLARDRWGTRSVACFSLLCTLAGAIGIAFSDPSNSAALATALFCISLGAGTQLVMQPVASLFPSTSNTIVSSLSGSFQISGLVFLALCSLPISRRDAFLAYGAVVATQIGLAWFLLPKSASYLPPPSTYSEEKVASYSSEQPEDHKSRHNNIIKNEQEEEDAQISHLPQTEKVTYSSPDQQPTDHTSSHKISQGKREEQEDARLSKLQQFISIEYILLFWWFSIILVPMQYYVGSIGYQLEEKGDDNGVYTNLFSIIYAASAIVAPAGGYLSDRLGLGLTQGLSTLLVALSFFILGSHKIPLPGQTVGLICYGVGRMLIFGMFFSNIGRRFGYAHYGTLSGVGLLGSAIASILQYPLIAAATNGAAQRVNFTSGLVLVALLPYCAWLAVTERKVDSARSLWTRSAGVSKEYCSTEEIILFEDDPPLGSLLNIVNGWEDASELLVTEVEV